MHTGIVHFHLEVSLTFNMREYIYIFWPILSLLLHLYLDTICDIYMMFVYFQINFYMIKLDTITTEGTL